MPHIISLSAPLGIAFRPIRYELLPTTTSASTSSYTIVSEVRVGVAGTWLGWLGAAGELLPADEDTSGVRISFTRFWLRDSSPQRDEDGETSAAKGVLDRAINALGRLLFIDALAVFPVRNLSIGIDGDVDFCLFEFPPLKSCIGAVRVSSAK